MIAGGILPEDPLSPADPKEFSVFRELGQRRVRGQRGDRVAAMLRAGALEYEWLDGWGPAANPTAWPHRGIVTLGSGDLAMYEAGAPRVQIIAPDGSLRSAVDMPVTEAHGMTYDRSTGVERLWLADAANQLRPDAG